MNTSTKGTQMDGERQEVAGITATWDEVSNARGAQGTEHKCRKCHKVTAGTFNEVTHKCFQCHMEEM